MIPQAWSRGAWGLIVGAVVLILVSALLTAAIYSVNTAHDLHSLSRGMVKAQRANEQSDNESEQRSAQAKAERQALLDQNAKLQAQLKALVTYLRDHGLPVPAPTVTPAPPLPSPTSAPSPKRTPTPRPTSKPTPNPACVTFPILCHPFSFPKGVASVGLPRQGTHPKAHGEQRPRHPHGKAPRVHGNRPGHAHHQRRAHRRLPLAPPDAQGRVPRPA